MMNIDTAYFHHVCINTLYGAAALLTFVIVERLVYYAMLNFRAASLVPVVNGTNPQGFERMMKRRDLLSACLAKYIGAIREPDMSRSVVEDLSTSLFIKVAGKIGARLWILDTIVTAAPLLGLLGTILGIMDTFNALSAGGISDPAAVSRGIAAALLATAIGIGVALFGLLGHNLLHRFSDHLTEEFKRLILASHVLVARDMRPATAAPVSVAARPSAPADLTAVFAK